MLNVENRFMIRDLYRQGVSISEIARRTGHDRKTIRHIINAPLILASSEQRPRSHKIDPYISYIERRMELGVLNARKLYGEIRAQGYPGKETQVRDYVHHHRATFLGLPLPLSPSTLSKLPTVRFETEPGEQAQVDWGSFGFLNCDGHNRRLYGFVMTLGWSRAMYLEFTLSADTAWWLRCHLHAFAYFGGVPRQILHDNLKSAVLDREPNGIIHWNPRYLDFSEHHGFTPKACHPYRPQTKGKVESGVKYVKANFWPGLYFLDLADLNSQGLEWLNSVANQRIHGTTGEVPFVRLTKEQGSLRSTSGIPHYDTSLVTYRRSTRDCLISYEGNVYSVPASYAHQRLLVKATERGELILLTEGGVEVARHPLAREGQHARVVQNAHYEEVRGVVAAAREQVRSRKPTQAVQLSQRTEAQREEAPEHLSGLSGLSGLSRLSLLAPAVEARPLSLYEQAAHASCPDSIELADLAELAEAVG
jgi:transposase